LLKSEVDYYNPPCCCSVILIVRHGIDSVIFFIESRNYGDKVKLSYELRDNAVNELKEGRKEKKERLENLYETSPASCEHFELLRVELLS